METKELKRDLFNIDTNSKFQIPNSKYQIPNFIINKVLGKSKIAKAKRGP